jgi:hypothetical protein
MTLKEARCKFSYLLAEKLLPFIRSLGYSYAFDEVTNHQGIGHMKDSLHYDGCAGDILLYKDGVYQDTTEAHKESGEYWKSLDPNCRWGGDWGDGNHYSYSPKELFGNRR